jgi:hypothetical protein
MLQEVSNNIPSRSQVTSSLRTHPGHSPSQRVLLLESETNRYPEKATPNLAEAASTAKDERSNVRRPSLPVATARKQGLFANIQESFSNSNQKAPSYVNPKQRMLRSL